MDLEQIRDHCLSYAGVEECFPFDEDTLVFKANRKMFLLVSLSEVPVQFNVKCDPDRAIALRDEHACIRPGCHMSKKHWNTVVVDGTLNNKMLKEQIAHSYELVTSSKKKSTVKKSDKDAL